MKKIFFFLAVAALFAACDNESNSGFSVTGKIENAAGKDLLLSVLGARSMDPVDTVKISEDGSFSINGTAGAPEFYTVSFLDTKEYITLVIDSASQIELNTDTTDFALNYTVSGSKDSELLKTLNDRLKQTIDRIDSLGAVYRENAGAENFDSIEVQIQGQYDAAVAEQKEFNKKIIDDNPNSLASLIALSQSVGPRSPVLTLDGDEDYFTKVDETLFAKYPNSEAVKSLHDYLKQYKEQQAAAKTGVQIGSEAPEINLPTPEGGTLALTSTRGNYVLLDFWAAWCRPCRAESPTLVKNYEKYKSKGFTIFQVSLDQTKDAWVEAIKADNLGAWHHVSDLQYWSSAPAQEYGVRSIPANFLLDPEGKVIATNLRGPVLGQKLREIYGF